MKNNSTPRKHLLKTLYCNVFGHHYVVSNKVTGHIKEYTCVHCQKQVTADESGKLSILTPALREINLVLGDMDRKRQRRIKVVNNAA